MAKSVSKSVSKQEAKDLKELFKENDINDINNSVIPLKSNDFHLLPFIILIIGITLNLYLLNYVVDIENMCECTKSWKRDFIKGYLIASVVYKTIDYTLYNNKFLSYSMLILGFVNIYVVFTYINELKFNKCKCSENTARNVMEILNYIRIGVIGSAILLLIYVFVRRQLKF